MNKMEQKKNYGNPLVGYCAAPQLSVQFSLTEAELQDLKRYLTGKDTKRVYLTLVTGEAKETKKPYSFIKVYDPNAQNGNPNASTYKGATPAKVEVSEDLPF